VKAVRAGRSWFSGPDSAVATVNGTRYRLTMEPTRSGGFLEALRRAVRDTPDQ
jgi:hypothetical protein